MIKNNFLLLVSILFVMSCTSKMEQKLEVSPLFSDNMVFQQKTMVPVWGKAAPGEKISVEFSGVKADTVADNTGNWMVKIGPFETRDTGILMISSTKENIKINNVLVGEVWICSGQSNMEMSVGCTWAKVNNSAEELANANYPEIRLFTVGRNIPIVPVDTIQSEGWKVCSPESVADFSAVGYFFGRELYTSQNIPIGLIQTNWGGTDAESWTSEEGLREIGFYNDQLNKLEELRDRGKSVEELYQEDYNNYLIETANADAGIEGDDTIFARPEFDDSDWPTMIQPKMWESTEVGAFDGVMWFRTTVVIPEDQAGKELTLSLAPPDDADETWFNGIKIGESKEWDVVRHYRIPSGVAKAGINHIVVRLSDPQGNGGFMGADTNFSVYSNDGWKAYYAGKMKYHKGFDKKDIKTQVVTPGNPNYASLLYNGMISPVLPYALRGVIWYQGENNTGKYDEYKTLFPGMISDWRKKWGQGDFPFLFVQLANFMEGNEEPVDHPWARLREAQTMALELENTGMAVSIDIGDPDDIHPGNKQDVGKRLSLAARAMIYNEDIPYSGPLYQSMEIMGSTIAVTFDHIYDGLQTSDKQNPIGFAIAGEDKQFYWAEAKIIGSTVLLSSKQVDKPVAVRYAWSSNPACNLYNTAGLPASPFRTDNWEY